MVPEFRGYSPGGHTKEDDLNIMTGQEPFQVNNSKPQFNHIGS